MLTILKGGSWLPITFKKGLVVPITFKGEDGYANYIYKGLDCADYANVDI